MGKLRIETGKHLEKYLVEKKDFMFWKKLGEFDSFGEAQEGIMNSFSGEEFISPEITLEKISKGKITYSVYHEKHVTKTDRDGTEKLGKYMYVCKVRISPRFYGE
jgi:hypothetical protein